MAHNRHMIIKAKGLFEAMMEVNLAKAMNPKLHVSISRMNRKWKVNIQ